MRVCGCVGMRMHWQEGVWDKCVGVRVCGYEGVRV